MLDESNSQILTKESFIHLINLRDHESLGELKVNGFDNRY